MRLNKLLPYFILSIMLLMSCSNLPAETKVKNDVQKTINEEFENQCELVDFEKVNAMEVDGSNWGLGQLYEVEFKGKLRYKSDFYFKTFGNFEILRERNNPNYYVLKKPLKIYSHQSNENFEKSLIKIDKNSEKAVQGIFRYVKKEKGWEPMKNSGGTSFIKMRFVEKK